MQPRSRSRLWDARDAAALVQEFVAGRTWDEFLQNDMLRSAVERQFTILGEALAQLRSQDPSTADQVPRWAQIVGFRNILIHGYAEVDNETVWRTATVDLEELIASITLMLDAEP